MDGHLLPVHAHRHLSTFFRHSDEPDVISRTQKLQPVTSPRIHLPLERCDIIVNLRITVRIGQAGIPGLSSLPVFFDVSGKVPGERRLPVPFTIDAVFCPPDIDRAHIFPGVSECLVQIDMVPVCTIPVRAEIFSHEVGQAAGPAPFLSVSIAAFFHCPSLVTRDHAHAPCLLLKRRLFSQSCCLLH